MIGLISLAEATVPPIPKGIFCMPATETNGFPDLILNDPRIVGLDVVDDWADVEATEGVYDWSYLDSELAKAEAHGKKVQFGIVSGGINVPDWLLANYPDIQTFSFIDTNPYHSTYNQRLTIPVFWDPIFLAKKIALIQAAGAHFASHSSIVVVGCAFANATTEDWNIPDAPEDITNWQAAGYTTELMVNTGEAIIDATMAAFPNQNVTMGIARGPVDLDPTPDYLSETIVDYATTTYGRFITAKYALAANTPDPFTDISLYNWQVLFDQCPNISTQMLWYVSGDSTYRMNGGIPGDPATVLLNAITVGAHIGTQFQEIYEKDLEDSTLSSIIDFANYALTVNPGGAPAPAAPSNLNATSGGAYLVNLTWADNAINELGYRIESKIGATGTYGLLTTLGPNTTAATINNNLIEGTQYYFRMQGVNAGGRSAYSNEASVATVLIAPGSLTAQPLSSSQVLLNWADNSATETGFRIERSPLNDTNFTEIATVGANTTAFTDSGLNEASRYWYRVRAYNANTTSDYSNEYQATTLYNIPAAPSGLTITSLLTNRVSLSWTDNSGDESGFNIQRKTGVTGTYVTIKTTVPNVTSYTDNDTALVDGTLYYYRVSATNPAGDSAFSNAASGTTPLAAPTSATATAVSSSQINLTWIDNSASETGYKIERKTTAAGTYAQIDQVGANMQTYSDTNGLSPNTRYYYRVRATNTTTDSGYSNEPSAVTFQVTPAPPSGLTITSVLTNKVTLSWSDNSNNETGFNIWRKTNITGTYVLIATTAANIAAYADNTVIDGTVYYYQVCATNAIGDSAFSNEASGTTPLATPTSASATAVSSSQINLIWIDNSASETGYKIERKTTLTGTYAQIDQVGANVQSYSDTNGLAPNTKYYYRVRASNGTIDSAYSNEPSAVTFQVTPTPPSGLTITSVLTNKVTLSWTDNSDNETGFKIQRKTGVTGTYTDIATTAANITAYADSAVVDGTVYYYRICATNAIGDSVFSNEASGTTLLATPTSATATAVSSSRINLTWIDNSVSETGYKIERKTTLTGTYAQIDQVLANVQSYSDTNGLAPNTKYYYRVRATNGTIDSAYSNEPFATTLLDVPGAPANLTITSILSNQVSLSWSDNSNNETGFKIQRKIGVAGTYTTIRTTGANATAYTDSALTDGTVYYYRVCATNATGDSAFSNETSGTTPLLKPSAATATAVSSSQINLTWIDNSASERGYKIERKTGAGGTFAQIDQVGANVQNYSDINGLSANTKYYYRIRATNGTIDSDYSNSPFATTLLDAPVAPSNLTITSVLSNKVSLSWTDNSNNETGFKIQRKIGITGNYVNITTTGANVTVYNDSSVADGTVYYYRVNATNATGDSPFSGEVNGTTPLATPTSATATAVSSSQINLTWIDNSASETGYKIERKTGATGTYAQIDQVGANMQHYSDNGLAPNTKYYYRVRATNGTIDSAYSNAPFATTLLDAPAPPSGLAITSVLSNKVSLSWSDNSNNETGFKIYRKVGITGTYVLIATTGGNVTAYNDSAVTDGTVYYYRVSATNATGDSAFSNEATGTTPLAKPTSATATAVSSSQICLTWVDNSASENRVQD